MGEQSAALKQHAYAFAQLVQAPLAQGVDVFSVDFDMTGIVNLPHSQPNPTFNLRDVRQRLYRGRCVNNKYVPASIAVFQEKRDSILGLVENLPGASRQTRSALRSYIKSFYNVIGNPRRVKQEIIDRCI